MEDSLDTWKYVIILGRFAFCCIDVSISKSFGVLFPTMMVVLHTDTKTLGFVCSLSSALIYFTSPAVAYILDKGWMTPRMCALTGAIFSSACLVSAGWTVSVPALAVILAITGIGMSMGYLSSKITLNEYFKRSYVLVAAIANIGISIGALVAPYIVERSLEAYGYVGAMVILGGITLHAIPASVTLRNRRDCNVGNDNHGREEAHALILDDKPSSKGNSTKSRQRSKFSHKPTKVSEDNQQSRPVGSVGTSDDTPDDTITQKLKLWVQNSIFIKEPLIIFSSPCIFLTLFGSTSWILFLVPRAEWHGIPSSKAVFLSTLGGAGGVTGQFIYTVLIYAGINAIPVSIFFQVVTAITFLIDPLLITFPVMCTVAFIQGLSIFTCQVATSAFPKYSVSDKNFAFAVGLQGALNGTGAIFGGFISGLIKDSSRSFTVVFLFLGAVFVVNLVATSIFYFAYRRVKTAPSPC